MTVQRLMLVAVALLFACTLVVAGCDSADTTLTTANANATQTTEATQLYPVKVDEKWGFIDSTGALKIKPQFELRTGSPGFAEGLAAVGVLQGTEPKFGYIDTTGAWVIQPQFVGTRGFSEGLAAVAVGTTDAMMWGYIDKTGAWVVQPRFDYAWDFSDSLAAVQVKDGDSIRSGYIDKTGKVVIPIQYEWAYDFSGGIAQVTYPYPSTSPSYIDKTGKVIWQDMNTSVSVDTGTHRATINYRTSGAFAITVLFLTYPDGRREMLGKGNIASGGASLGTAELSPGNYTYTVYWVPQEDQDPDSVSVETLVETGQKASGNFTVE